ncbi:trypsin-like serine peptidase [Nodosilinea nodulosa]|uniref:trypsin-like serine peptidase n=1 Tax=Nodosilinea nodulosa TaxID=416001 RepID=UPI0002F7B68B|nr:trypsin-like peptidase domain-containing protein [Nodosilinea nodulosa]
MKPSSSPLQARVALAGSGVALLALGTMANLSAQAQSIVAQSLSQVQQTAAAKVVAFGLTPNPRPIVPEGLSQSRNPAEGSRGTIGLSDDRVAMTSTSYPWSAIGRLQSPEGDSTISICTGSLVAPDVVLTNAHCVIDAETHRVKADITFEPNLINGRVSDDADVAAVVDVLYGTDFSNSDAALQPNDWAFVRLDRPLGNKYGTLAWTQLPVAELLDNYQGQIILAGYSGDFPENAPAETAGVHDGCSILGEAQGNLIHDCDTYGGSSGGPMLAVINGEFRIVALNVAERFEEGTVVSTGATVRAGIVNYGVKIDPIVSFIRQSSN